MSRAYRLPRAYDNVPWSLQRGVLAPVDGDLPPGFSGRSLVRNIAVPGVCTTESTGRQQEPELGRVEGTMTGSGVRPLGAERNNRMSTVLLSDAVDGRAADGQWAVETHGLIKRFGENVAVNDVELLVPRGCAFGYLGPNGAGKTTLIRVLLGLTHADAGTMFLLGHAVPRHRDVALARVGAIVDEPRFHGHLTGRQNLQILAAAREPAAEGRIAPALERVGILHRADDKVSKYSMGMRQRLGVAACLLGDPQLLILDEPMNGLDPAGMLDMRDMIKSLVSEGRTVVLSSHLLDEVERTCDAVAIVDRGTVIRQGPIAQLLAGSSFEVQVECSDPDRALGLLEGTSFGVHVQVRPDGLAISLPEHTERDAIAEINRVLVEGGIAVYRLQHIQASLEQWFLSVTSRLGASE